MTWKTNTRKSDGAPITSSKQNCHCCDKAIEPIWKDDPRKADTWFWDECSECGEPICDDAACFDRIPQKEDHQNDMVCTFCLQHPKFRNPTPARPF